MGYIITIGYFVTQIHILNLLKVWQKTHKAPGAGAGADERPGLPETILHYPGLRRQP